MEGGGGHPDPKTSGGPVSKKDKISVLRFSVWSKKKRGPPLDPPLIPDRFNFHRGATISYQL